MLVLNILPEAVFDSNEFTSILLDKENIEIKIIECEDCHCQEPDLLTQLQEQTCIEDMKDIFNHSIYGKVQNLLNSDNYEQIRVSIRLKMQNHLLKKKISINQQYIAKISILFILVYIMIMIVCVVQPDRIIMTYQWICY